MTANRSMIYRDYEVITRATGNGQTYLAGFNVFPLKGESSERISRLLDREYADADEAHLAALETARKLIDLLLASKDSAASGPQPTRAPGSRSSASVTDLPLPRSS